MASKRNDECQWTISDNTDSRQFLNYFLNKTNNDHNKSNHPNLPSSNSNDSLERFLEGSKVPANPGGPPVGAVGRVVAFIELGQKTVYLGLGKCLVGPDGAVTGHDHTAFIQHFRQAG